MKVRHVLAIIAAATAFVAYFDDPAHSATINTEAQTAGYMVQAANTCHFKPNAYALTVYSTTDDTDSLNLGVDLFDQQVAEKGLGVACGEYLASK